MNGCGKQMYVAGTNGGRMACGSTLKHLDGRVTVETCEDCKRTEHETVSVTVNLFEDEKGRTVAEWTGKQEETP